MVAVEPLILSQAIPCLRYLYEEVGRLPVIAAGSLLEFTLNDHEYSMPVGRIEYLHMGPMNFSEFLQARNEDFLFTRLKSMESFKPLSQELHEKASNLLREYLFVGGMPEAIKTFIELGIEHVPEIHSQILQAYQADFVKYAKKSHLDKIQKVFRYAFLNPCQKIKLSNISMEDLSRDLRANLNLLIQAKVIHPVYHVNCDGLPLRSSENEKVFKIIGLDVGLTNHQAGLKWKSFKKYGENEILSEFKLLAA